MTTSLEVSKNQPVAKKRQFARRGFAVGILKGRLATYLTPDGPFEEGLVTAARVDDGVIVINTDKADGDIFVGNQATMWWSVLEDDNDGYNCITFGDGSGDYEYTFTFETCRS